ncbi:hypothetical protein K2173_021689 [Erythroxylum novogranatense]|uniref:DUF4378 domain-containing protein n=1 Tax=Erythroxylum novogranatense TaxID=1862640 RepID=A0AAV8TH87_9ROSI|nr:hypothetical protein K2173_021689 [Erythroxylum novogranatense]
MASSCNPQKRFLFERKTLMLKDFLLDDLSSCSSNGFRSFPRRQCCSTVRLLLEVELKSSHHPYSKPIKRQNLKGSSLYKKTSGAVINAVKLLRFPSSIKSPSLQERTGKGSFLRRSLSRRLFIKKVDKKEDRITQWKSFREFLEDKQEPADQPSIPQTTATEVIHVRHSVSSSSNIKSNSWTDSESTGESENSEFYKTSNDAVEEKKESLPKDIEGGARVGVTDGEDSIINYSTDTPKIWGNGEEKEQFSPVSVLDPPFQDEEETYSPVEPSLVRLEGTKQKLRSFESLTQLVPVDLEKRLALAESDDASLESMSIQKNNFNEMQEERQSEKEAQELLKLVKAATQHNSLLLCSTEALFLDFFMEMLEQDKATESVSSIYEKDQVLKVVEDWVKGNPQETFLGWEVKNGRHTYIKDLEKNGRWRNVEEEKEEVVLELEQHVFTSLLNEAFLDIL